jgi:hypothetical protein
MTHLILFGTSGCHLCEQAEATIKACILDHVSYVDIAEQEQWQERYAIRIPVLCHPESLKELCWPFDQTDVEIFISQIEMGNIEVLS